MSNKSKQFVSTPISVDLNDLKLHTAKNAPTSMPQWQPDSLYPEIYNEVYPQIVDAVNQLLAGRHTPTPEMISSLVDAIIKNSGMWYEDEDEDGLEANVESLPPQFSFSIPYRRRRRRHHNRNTLRDVIRILLLRELRDRR